MKARTPEQVILLGIANALKTANDRAAPYLHAARASIAAGNIEDARWNYRQAQFCQASNGKGYAL